MKKIGVFFGSDTGNTEKIAKLIQKKIGYKQAILYDISSVKKEDIEKFEILLFGVSTWYYGELQCDWDNFLPILQEINFKNKIVGLFGCGDQEDYSEYFCDGLGILYNIVKLQGANVIGKWLNKNYFFESSKALLNKEYFFGLIIDEDRQPELSEIRVQKWIIQIRCEIEKILKLKTLNRKL